MLKRFFFRYIQKGSKAAMSEVLFPKSLNEFGYGFDADGRLRRIKSGTDLLTDESFEFNITDDVKFNQKRYEALGEIINEYVYDLLEQEGLKRLMVPRDDTCTNMAKSFVFASADVLKREKLIILIHGSGVVRAGQWSRRLIINDSLSSGAQIPYIKKATELGYGIFVLNTNDNYRTSEKDTQKIKGSGDAHEHLETVWSDYIWPCNANRIAVVAHSYGGECITRFAEQNVEEFKKKVFAVALTDSVHILPSAGFGHVAKIARNWACSEKPLDSPLPTVPGDIERVSAGTMVHEMSSASSMDSIFKFFEDRCKIEHSDAQP